MNVKESKDVINDPKKNQKLRTEPAVGIHRW